MAFMDLGTAFRSYIERRSFLDHADTQFIEGMYVYKRPIFIRHNVFIKRKTCVEKEDKNLYKITHTYELASPKQLIIIIIMCRQ